jgi:hypothetical protein
MTPHDVLRHLQRLRYSPRSGRPISLAWIARQAGYRSRHVLHDVLARGSISADMARRLAPVLARLYLAEQGDNSPTLGRLGADDAAGRGHRRRPGREAPAPPGAPPRKAKVETRDG